MLIYDFSNDSYELEINPDYIKRIHVSVVTGDEVITFYYINGASPTYDASKLLGSGRILDDVDCDYWITERDSIRRFMEYNPPKSCEDWPRGKTISYERARTFGAKISQYAD